MLLLSTGCHYRPDAVAPNALPKHHMPIAHYYIMQLSWQ